MPQPDPIKKSPRGNDGQVEYRDPKAHWIQYARGTWHFYSRLF